MNAETCGRHVLTQLSVERVTAWPPDSTAAGRQNADQGQRKTGESRQTWTSDFTNPSTASGFELYTP